MNESYKEFEKKLLDDDIIIKRWQIIFHNEALLSLNKQTLVHYLKTKTIRYRDNVEKLRNKNYLTCS